MYPASINTQIVIQLLTTCPNSNSNRLTIVTYILPFLLQIIRRAMQHPSNLSSSTPGVVPTSDSMRMYHSSLHPQPSASHFSNPALVSLGGVTSFSSQPSSLASQDLSSAVVNGSSMSNQYPVSSSLAPLPQIALSQAQMPSLPHPAQQQGPMHGVRFFPGSYDKESVYQWILELTHPDTRERALFELCKKREDVPDLAPMLWHSFGTIAALLQEIIMIYPLINPPTLNNQQSNRVCNALALLQCVASHSETRTPFLDAQIPMFLYPFLNTSSRTRPYEYLRLTSLGVVGALVKTDEQEVIQFLLSTEIIPLCLRIMENGSDLSKTVATFILQKILQDVTGLTYICHTCERFLHVSHTLCQMIQSMAKEVTVAISRLLKHVIRCYLRLADDPRAREALKQYLPDQLKDNTFAIVLREDQSTQTCLAQLLQTLQQTNLASLDAAVPSMLMQK